MNDEINFTEDEYLAQVKELGGYLAVRRLSDGTIAALGDLMFTRAIYMGCDLCGWSHRFCFADRALAVARFARIETAKDEPAGFVARRPEVWPRLRG